MISRPENSFSSPPILAVTPVARRPSNTRPVTKASVQDAEIGAAAHIGAEIADRRRGALERPVAHRHRAIAVAEIGIHVGDERHLPLLRKSVHRLRQWRPIVGRGAADRHRPILAVQRAAEIEIVLELAVIGQHVVPAPTGGAERLPFGIIVGRAAIGDHAHHRAAATHDAALGKSDRRRIVLAPPMHLQLGPEIGVVVVGPRIAIEHIGRLRARRRVASGFEQQHAQARARRQPVRQHATRRAGADDDDVEALGHASPHAGRIWRNDWTSTRRDDPGI